MSTLDTMIAAALERREAERIAKERKQAAELAERRAHLLDLGRAELEQMLGAELLAALGAVEVSKDARTVGVSFGHAGREFALLRQGNFSYRLVDVTGGKGEQRIGDFTLSSVGGKVADELLLALATYCEPRQRSEDAGDDLRYYA